MLEIKSFVFGPFQTNCYVVSGEQQILLVDPACSNEYERGQLEQYISNHQSPGASSRQTGGAASAEKGYNPSPITIVATHGHLDHLWGAAWACAKWNTPVLMHEADIPMAKAMQQQYDLFGIPAKAQPFPIEDVKSKIINHKFEISNFQLLSTPGHTPGSICLYFPKSPITRSVLPTNGRSGLRREGLSPFTNPFILSGDTLFKMGYGRTDLPGGNYSQLMNSLEHLFTLPSDVLVYPGHGEPTTIGAERR